MIKLLRTLLCIGVLLLGLLSTANANLVARPGGMVYDTDLNITWLSDANYAKTSGYDADGLMNWNDANTWAASLKIGGVSGWRLPTADTSCSGHNCSNSEMGHLFYDELGGIGGFPLPFTSLFSNIQESNYWSNPELAPGYGWYFWFSSGHQGAGIDGPRYSFGWAVHDGDVAAIPEPEMYAMMVLGLAVLLGFGRLRQQS